MKKVWIIALIFFGVLVLGNLGFLDWQYFSKIVGANHDSPAAVGVQHDAPDKSETGLTEEEEDEAASPLCELACQNLIKDEIEKQLSALPSQAGQSSVSPIVPKVPEATNQQKIVYVPLVSSGDIFSIDWMDIVPSEFYFDLSDYPSAKEVRFEAFLLSTNGDSVSARIYDQTNKRGVDYSELQSSSSTFTRIQSSAIKIWRGNNKYTVQLRSVNGTQVQLQDAKLLITF